MKKNKKQVKEDELPVEEVLGEPAPESNEEVPVGEEDPPPLPPDGDSKYQEMLDRYQRCLAEFDNYRKRTVKEMTSRYDDGIRAACEKLLPIIDNFERAMSAGENLAEGPPVGETAGSDFYQGIALIARQFGGVLSELGVEQIAIDPGGNFDANLHYAVAHTEDENFGENAVTDVLQKGYVHKERVLRPAMVKVAN